MSAISSFQAHGMRPLLVASLFVVAGMFGSAQAAEGDARQQIIDHARGQVLRDMQSLEKYLSRGGASVVAGWQQYLHLDALQTELAKPEPDAARLTDIWNEFYTPTEGLEKEKFLRLRDSLRNYQLVAATPEGDLRKTQADALARLEEQLAAYRESDSRDDAYAIGQTLAWLSATGADKATIERVRKEFGHPNAYIRVSSRLANYFLTRQVVDRERVSANLNGTQTSGNAETRATLWLKTITENRHGAIDIRLTGKSTTSDSVAHKGPVTIYGSAVTNIDARVRLTLHDDLLRIEPPIVHAVTKSTVNDIEAKRRIIERLAWRRVPKEKPAAEQAAARHVEQHLAARLSDETKKLIAQANNMYADKVRLPMTRRGAWPQLRYFSDTDSLHIRMYQVNQYQVAAPNRPPQWPVQGDLTLAGHESMFENMFDGIYAGREIRDERFLYLHDLLTGESPRALWVHDREPRWSVIMASERPLRLRLREGQMQMTLAIAETIRGNERFDMPALVTAVYTAEPSGDGPVFHRQGDVTIEFPDRERDSMSAEKLHAFLERKFSAVMPKDLHFDGLSAPAGGFGDKLNQLVIREISFKQGWATLSYQLDMSRKPKTQLITASELGN